MGYGDFALGVAKLMFWRDAEKNRQALIKEDQILRGRQESRLQAESEAKWGRLTPQIQLPRDISTREGPTPRKRPSDIPGPTRRVWGTEQKKLAEQKRGHDLQERAIKITEQEFMKDLDAIKKSDQQVRPQDVLATAIGFKDMDDTNKSQVSKHFEPLINYAKDLVAQKQQAGEGEAQGITRYELFQGLQTILQQYKPKILEGLEKDIESGRLKGRNMEEIEELYDEVKTDTFLLNEMPNSARRADFEKRLEEIEGEKAETQLTTAKTQLVKAKRGSTERLYPTEKGYQPREKAIGLGKPTEIKETKEDKKRKGLMAKYFSQIGRYYSAKRGENILSEAMGEKGVEVAIEALKSAQTIAIEYVKSGGKAEELGITAEGIRADYKAKRITKERAVQLLRELFGMK